MATYIAESAYSTLASYTVLGGSGVNFPPSPGTTLSPSTTYYGSNPTATVTGVVNGATVTTGNNVSQDATARTQRQALYNFLTTQLPIGFSSTTVGSGPTFTFGPITHLISVIDFPIGSTINLVNPFNIANPQWVFISNSSITFNTVSTLNMGPATPQSVYWVAKSSITVDVGTTATLQGVFIAYENITFEGPSVPDPGAAYAGAQSSGVGAVTFEIESTMSSLGFPPVSGICFPGYTPINTDQGIIAIDKLIAGTHTINNKRIVTVTKTIDENTFMVCFKKDSLGENIPSEDTITSKHHGVEYNGEMYPAYKLLDHVENVVKVEYNGELMYNILMDEHEKITVNNLTCETLHPKHWFAKKFNTPLVTEEKVSTTELLCA